MSWEGGCFEGVCLVMLCVIRVCGVCATASVFTPQFISSVMFQVVLPPPLRQSVLLRVRKSHTVRRAAMQHRTMSVRVMVRELTKRALLCAIRFFQGGGTFQTSGTTCIFHKECEVK